MSADNRHRCSGPLRLLALAGLLASAWHQMTLAQAFAESTSSTARAEQAPPRNVVVITIDTLRADALGFAGNKAVETPTLDRLAYQGRVWSQTHAHSVTTLPSHASLFTGLYPYEHGVRANGRFVLDGGVATMASRLRQRGFVTGAFVGAFPLDSRFGLDQGFDTYDDDYAVRDGDQTFRYSEREAREVVVRATRWWREHEGRRRFLWMHLFDPHTPYEPPEPFASRFANQPYLGEVSAVDAALTPFLQSFFAGREDPTLIVVTSDHGEGLGEHGELTHGLFAYEPTLRVPLVFWGPGVPGGVDTRPARLVDILPTLLDLLKIEPDPELTGTSLLAPSSDSASSYFEALSTNFDYGWAPLRGVVAGRRKFIELPLPELYDLRLDPEERHNLIDSEPAVAQRLAAQLPEEATWPPVAGEAAAEDLEQLRALGYVIGAQDRRSSYSAADDPKNLVELDHKMTSLYRLYSLDQLEDAEALARDVISARPSMTLPQLYLGRILLARGELAAALEVLEAARREGRGSRELLVQLSLALTRAGRPQEALETLSSLTSSPQDTDVLNARAGALLGLGRYAEAEQQLEDALHLNPRSALAWELKSFLALAQSQYQSARESAERALQVDAERADAWNNLAVALYFLDLQGPAAEAWRRALQIAPRHPDALLSLGVVAAETGHAEEARDLLQRFMAAADPSRYAAARQRAAEILRQLPPG